MALDQSAVSEEARFLEYLETDCSYLDVRSLGDGRYSAIMPLLFTHAIIVGRIGDRVGYSDRWCGDYVATAKAAASLFRGPSDFLFRSCECRFQ